MLQRIRASVFFINLIYLIKVVVPLSKPSFMYSSSNSMVTFNLPDHSSTCRVQVDTTHQSRFHYIILLLFKNDLAFLKVTFKHFSFSDK